MGWTIKDYSSLLGAKEKNIYDVRLKFLLVLFEWKRTMHIECNGHSQKNKKVTIILQYFQINMAYNLN